MNYIIALFLSLLATGMLPSQAYSFDIRGGVTLELRSFEKTFGAAQNVPIWTYCLAGLNVTPTTPGSCAGAPVFPGPLLEIGAGQSANVTLSLTNTVNPVPNEDPLLGTSVPAFFGHTVHFSNLHLPAIHDGIPRPFPPTAVVLPTNTSGHTYTIDLAPPNSDHIGGHAYYCHVHQNKHLEMGEFGALIVRPVTNTGVFTNTINQGGPIYDVEENFILSTIDISYHFADVIGEDPVFATYNPTVFLINGTEGVNTGTPAVTINALVNQAVAIRLLGMHSVNATFQIVSSVTNDVLGPAQPFTLHNIDGRAQKTPKTVPSVDLSPGQTKDVLVSMPATATTWYGVVSYKNLRDDSLLANVYSVINIQ